MKSSRSNAATRPTSRESSPRNSFFGFCDAQAPLRWPLLRLRFRVCGCCIGDAGSKGNCSSGLVMRRAEAMVEQTSLISLGELFVCDAWGPLSRERCHRMATTTTTSPVDRGISFALVRCFLWEHLCPAFRASDVAGVHVASEPRVAVASALPARRRGRQSAANSTKGKAERRIRKHKGGRQPTTQPLPHRRPCQPYCATAQHPTGDYG